MTYSLLLFGLVLGFSAVTCRTIYLEMSLPTDDELSFLQRYGYLPSQESGSGELDSAYTPLSIAEAVRRMQAFAGLPATGSLDHDTRKLFSMKRCGVKDLHSSGAARRRRYVVQQGWNKRTITYRVVNGSRSLPAPHVERLMRAALAVWAPHGGLAFHATDRSPADIQVSFVSGDHGDGFPFDGPGRVVAHAFPPPHGAMHFDEDETWSGGEGDGDGGGTGGTGRDEDDDVTDFFAVAVHEAGHALGLSHSTVKASVMYPYYQVPVDRLHMDDILGMRELYLKEPQSVTESQEGGGAVTERWEAVSSPVPHYTMAESEEDGDIPDLCYTNYDTITAINGQIYVFEEEWVWMLPDRKQVSPGWPRRFRAVFAGLPAHVSTVRTVYQRQDGRVVIFQGRRYWEFEASRRDSFRLRKKGTLKQYSLPPQVPELSTVFLSSHNNKTYLIEYERFWRYDESARRMDPGYPKEMTAWRDVPYPVDSAFCWHGDTYFFRGPRFWRFDDSLVQAHEYYPLPTAQVWFPCGGSPDMARYVVNDGP